MQYSQNSIVPLQETVAEKVLIRQGINQFNKHINLNDAVNDWKKTHIPKIMEDIQGTFHKSSNKEPEAQWNPKINQDYQ